MMCIVGVFVVRSRRRCTACLLVSLVPAEVAGTS